MPVITHGAQHGCFVFASYVNFLVIAENHICLICMLLLSICEVVWGYLRVFCDVHAIFVCWFSHFLMDLDISNIHFLSSSI